VREIAERLVMQASTENSVLVGRGSAYYLRDRTDAFHVFTYASFDEKVRRLRETGKSEREATDLVQTVDDDRAAFIKQRFGIDWPSRHFFHLMVNTRVGVESAVEIILSAVAAVENSVPHHA